MRPKLMVIAVATGLLAGCATTKPPSIAYDDVPPPAPPVVPVALTDAGPTPLHVPPPLQPARGGPAGTKEAEEPVERIDVANAAARVEPQKAGWFNAVQVFSYSPGALYQIYAAPGHVTEIALEPGERLTGPGPIAAGDTTRWIIGDTVSGSGETERVHLLVKPTRPDLVTNLVVNTDRRSYHVELRSTEDVYMASVAWAYPESERRRTRTAALARPSLPPPSERLFRYAIAGDDPPWRPVTVFDDRRKVYVVFPRGIAQGEMPPLLAIGADGKPQLVNFRVLENVMIVDRLFGAAELRLGGRTQEVVRIVRTDGTVPKPVGRPTLIREEIGT